MFVYRTATSKRKSVHTRAVLCGSVVVRCALSKTRPVGRQGGTLPGDQIETSPSPFTSVLPYVNWKISKQNHTWLGEV